MNWDGGAIWQRIFDFGNDTSQNMFLTPRSSANTLRFAIKSGVSEQILQTTALPAGIWQHVAVTLSGNTGRLYVNGALAATSASMTINPSSFNPGRNYIGKSQWPDPLFNGRIDGFHIYSYAFSGAQIASLYTNSPPAFTTDPFARPNATPGRLYGGTIAGAAADPNGGEMIYSKVSGPAWLQLASDGTLSGTPGAANVGPNSFTVRVTNPTPISDDATLSITVTPGADGVGVFAFENNVNNSRGFNHGTASGSPTYVPGVNGRAINFDGVDDFVTLPSGMMTVNDITIATRVNWDGGAQWQRIFDFGTGTSRYMFLTPRSGGDTLRFVITAAGNSAEQRLETSQLAPNQWFHLAVTLFGNTGKLYVNGAPAVSGTITLNPSSFNPTLNYIGKSQFAADAAFDGRLDDFHIYNRALSDFEIAALANPGVDSDGDGHFDSSETEADTDGDTTPNYLDIDSDNDDLPDSMETFGDTDGDGMTNIRDPDSDNDSMRDGWEFTNGLNPLNAADANSDLDGDGQSNAVEHAAGTLPNDAIDYFYQTVQSVSPFSVIIAGKAARAYTLLRAASTDAGPDEWTPVATSGALPSNQPVVLVDPAAPTSAAFYRSIVEAP